MIFVQPMPARLMPTMLGALAQAPTPVNARVTIAKLEDLARLARSVAQQLIDDRTCCSHPAPIGCLDADESFDDCFAKSESRFSNGREFIRVVVPIYEGFLSRLDALNIVGGVSVELQTATDRMIPVVNQDLFAVQFAPDLAARKLFQLQLPPVTILRRDEIAAGLRRPDEPEGSIVPPAPKVGGDRRGLIKFALVAVPIAVAVGVVALRWRR